MFEHRVIMAPKRTPMVRMFDGKGYAETVSYPSKARANQAVKQDKRPKTKYRIIKTAKGYTVYIRRSR